MLEDLLASASKFVCTDACRLDGS